MTSSWYGEVKVHEIKPDLPLNLTAARRQVAGLKCSSRYTSDLNERGMWRSLSAIVWPVKWLTMSYTAAGLLFVTVRALGTRSTVESCDKDGVRPDFSASIHAVMAWRQDGGETLPSLVQFPKLRF
jgi:hypothetical protein